jgi:hypothetical protein
MITTGDSSACEEQAYNENKNNNIKTREITRIKVDFSSLWFMHIKHF